MYGVGDVVSLATWFYVFIALIHYYTISKVCVSSASSRELRMICAFLRLKSYIQQQMRVAYADVYLLH